MTRRMIDKCDACGAEKAHELGIGVGMDCVDYGIEAAMDTVGKEFMGSLQFMFGRYDLCMSCMTKAAAAVGLKPPELPTMHGGMSTHPQGNWQGAPMVGYTRTGSLGGIRRRSHLRPVPGDIHPDDAMLQRHGLDPNDPTTGQTLVDILNHDGEDKLP